MEGGSFSLHKKALMRILVVVNLSRTLSYLHHLWCKSERQKRDMADFSPVITMADQVVLKPLWREALRSAHDNTAPQSGTRGNVRTQRLLDTAKIVPTRTNQCPSRRR